MTFVPLTDAERAAMLAAMGLPSIDALFEVIPEDIRYPEIDLGPALTELEVTDRLERLAATNRPVRGTPCFLGAGAYRHFIPSAVSTILSRSEFNTAYTPYQPEVSQGTLQASFEFQSLICDLTGMDVTNASVYDGASAVAEAALMAMRLTRRSRIVISGSVHPHYREVLQTYLGPREVDIATGEITLGPAGLQEPDLRALVDEETACVIVSQPGFFGEIRDLSAIVEAAHRVGALVVEVYNPTSLGMLRPPGDWGVDIAVAEGQPLGIPLSYGGPYVGLMSCKSELVRQMPGRIVGQTRDAEGRRGYVLTLQAREQHIRREKATSNICTSQTLIALGVATYLGLVGPQGLKSVAEACWQNAHYAASQLRTIPGVQVATAAPFFHEFAIRTPVPAAQLNRVLLEDGIVGGYAVGHSYPGLDNVLLLCCTELTNREQIDLLVERISSHLQHKARTKSANHSTNGVAVGEEVGAHA
jgi:glycine dehydrogenase subunit 1